MLAIPSIWTPQPAHSTLCPRCGKLLRRAASSVLDRAKRLRASFNTLFVQGGYVEAGGEVVKPVGAVVGDTADCGVCPCAGGGSVPNSCTCGTCSSASTPRAVHLLGFDGTGQCFLLPTKINYFKVTGTIDLSVNLPLRWFDDGTPTVDNPYNPCYYTWEDFYGFTKPSGLRVSYYRDAACTIPEAVAGGVTSNPLWLTYVLFEYGCGYFDEVTQTFGNSGLQASFGLSDNHFFYGGYAGGGVKIVPSPSACNDTVTLSFPATLYTADATLYPPATFLSSGSMIVSAV